MATATVQVGGVGCPRLLAGSAGHAVGLSYTGWLVCAQHGTIYVGRDPDRYPPTHRAAQQSHPPGSPVTSTIKNIYSAQARGFFKKTKGLQAIRPHGSKPARVCNSLIGASAIPCGCHRICAHTGATNGSTPQLGRTNHSTLPKKRNSRRRVQGPNATFHWRAIKACHVPFVNGG